MSHFTPWKILHLDLNNQIEPLTVYPNYQGLYVVFWWQNIPLGHSKISGDELPMSATQLLNIGLKTITPTVSAYLLQEDLNLLLPETISNLPSKNILEGFYSLAVLEKPLNKIYESVPVSLGKSISIIIPTRNRSQQLAKCLHSLQNLSQSPHEIIVVDNAPSTNTTQELVAQMSGIRYLLEPEPGASKARNRGIRHATGDIIAFIDDDMTAHPDWLTRLQQNFDVPEVMAVTGLVFPGELETEAQFIFEEYWSFNRGYWPLNFDAEFFKKTQSRGVPVWTMGGSGNMAIRRQIIDLLGGFDERLGSGPQAAGCSEDSEFFYRLLAEGLLCRYEPTAVAYHYHRADMDQLKKQTYGYMRGHVAALLIQFEKYKHWGNLRRVLLSLPNWYLHLFRQWLKPGFNRRNITLFTEVLGCASGVSFYLKNKNRGQYCSVKHQTR